MTPESIRDLLRIGLGDLIRADELLAGTVRRRQYGDLRVLGNVDELGSDPVQVAIGLARRSIDVAIHEMISTLDMQVPYLRTVDDLTNEYLDSHGDERGLRRLLDENDEPPVL